MLVHSPSLWVRNQSVLAGASWLGATLEAVMCQVGLRSAEVWPWLVGLLLRWSRPCVLFPGAVLPSLRRSPSRAAECPHSTAAGFLQGK